MILSLFSFVRANDNSSTVEWSPAQFEELQLQVLNEGLNGVRKAIKSLAVLHTDLRATEYKSKGKKK